LIAAQFRSRQFLAFLVSGGIAALANFVSRIVLNQWLSFSVAVVLAYLIGMVTAFVLARLFVFTESTQAVHRSALIFVGVNVLAIAQTWGISMLLAYWVLPAMGFTRFVPEIAHGIGVLVPVFTSYLGHKHWSFR
jgi:putative flippase GtrA